MAYSLLSPCMEAFIQTEEIKLSYYESKVNCQFSNACHSLLKVKLMMTCVTEVLLSLICFCTVHENENLLNKSIESIMPVLYMTKRSLNCTALK